jgi:Uma2 family endonuclease
MTRLQFDALPYEEGRLQELIEGELIPVSGPTLEHQEIVFRILMALKQHQINPSLVPIQWGPDLAVEVISPSEYAADSMRQVAAWIDNGVQEV